MAQKDSALATTHSQINFGQSYPVDSAPGSDKIIAAIKRKHHALATKWYRRYGRCSLLLSWAPVVGDSLTVVAGTLREPLWSFVAIVAVAKVARYLVVAGATVGLI